MYTRTIDESEHIREMYARYGLAMYFAHVLETIVRHALVMAKLSTNVSATRNDYDELFSDASTSVLGRLIGSLEPFLGEDDSLVSDLALALRARNQLAHHFFWDHATDANSTSGRNHMIAESIAFSNLFNSVATRLEQMTRQQLLARHVSDSDFEASVSRELHALQNRPPDVDQGRCIRCDNLMNTVQSTTGPFRECPHCRRIAIV